MVTNSRTEADFAFDKIINILQRKKIMLPGEFNLLTERLSREDIGYIRQKLLALNYVINEDMIEFTEKSKPEKEVKDSELLDL